MKKFLIFICLLVLLPVRAGFFDDLFSSSDDNTERGPFYFNVRDSLKNSNEVSFENRKLRIKMYFYTQFYNAINSADEDDLEEFFNSNLDVTTQKVKDGPKEKLGQGLTFRLESLPDVRNNERYSFAIFESTNISIVDSQKLIFKFDQEAFADDLNIVIDQNEEEFYKTTLNYKPLSVELKDLTIVDEDGVLSISGDFKSAFDIDEAQEEVSFELFRNGAKVKSTAKKLIGSKASFNLTPSLVSEQGDFLTKVSAGNYRIKIPLTLSLVNSGSASQIGAGELLKLKVPVLVDSKTNSGLEVKIKSLVKAELADFL